MPVIQRQPEESLKIKQVKVLGNTAFKKSELDAAIARFIGQKITLTRLEEIREAIANLYIQEGYVTSGAYLPVQDLSSSTIVIQVVEGQLEKIEIRGLERLQESYISDRLKSATEKPLNINRLEKALQLLQLNPLIKTIRAELKQGRAPGLNVLEVEAIEADAFSVGLQFNNYESPVIGELQGAAIVEHQNLLGFGDRAYASYGVTEGLDKFNISYAVPFNAQNGTVKVEYNSGDNRIVEEFEDLGIRAESERLLIAVRQPLVQSPSEEFTLFMALDLQESRTFILEDFPFSFTVGPERGKSRVTALRLGQEWLSRSTDGVIGARSQFSIGLDWFDATVNDSGTDGQFFSWQGQFQWVEKLDEDITFLVRTTAQLTPDSLLPIEQFDIGGIDTVRGYRQNLRVGDNGLSASAEVRFLLFNDEDWGSLEVAPFVDFGTVWSERTDALEPNTLVSTGASLRWQWQDSLFVRLDYGIPLVEVENRGDSLQESGLSFSAGASVKF
ncbi:MAG: ShlB/FhaC/HecB family hemolysin secretion/activation protein [Hydrococcus sp. Prado102]|nr:ShlB/FhaC/HecB family hemolysin secretion/activation protein [Hydrococcus sp. Prado102]